MVNVMYEHAVALRGTVGSVNYNLVVPGSDVDHRTFLFPTLDDVFTNRKLDRCTVSADADDSINDVRRLPHVLVVRPSINALETLFAKDVHCAPTLRPLVVNRERVAAANLPYLVTNSREMSANRWRMARKGVDAGRNAATAARVLLTCAALLRGVRAGTHAPFADALAFTGALRDRLLAAKTGQLDADDLAHLMADAEEALASEERLGTPPVDAATQDWVDRLVREAFVQRLVAQAT